MDESADAAAALAMFERCASGGHDDGDLDRRVVGFYERLQAEFPDHPPYPADSPWMSMPLSVGVDHVIMHLGSSPRSDPAITLIQGLAVEYGLVLWDPQSQHAYLPQAWRRNG